MFRDLHQSYCAVAFCSGTTSFPTVKRLPQRATTLSYSLRTEAWPNGNSFQQNKSELLTQTKRVLRVQNVQVC
jgi:hypothetical protein